MDGQKDQLPRQPRRAGPDVHQNGRVVFIEFKRPGKLKNTSTGQNDTIKDLIAAGAECHVVDTPLAVYRILGIKR